MTEPTPILGALYQDDGENKTKLYPETSVGQVKLGAGVLTDVLPTPVEKALLGALTLPAPGIMEMCAAQRTPAGWLRANGELYPKADKPALFAALGTVYGESSDKSRFALPRVAPVSVGGLGEVYIPTVVPVEGTEVATYMNTIMYCDDDTEPFLYLCDTIYGSGSPHIKISLRDGSTQRSPGISGMASTAGIHFCTFDGYLYTRTSTTSIERRLPLEMTAEKLPITLPAGFCSFCVDNTNGDIFMLATPNTATGRGLWRWVRATQQLKELKNLDDIHKPSGIAATYRNMQYDPVEGVLYFFSSALTQDSSNTYRLLTYDIKNDLLTIGASFPTWPKVLQYIGSKMYVAMDPSQDIQYVDRLGQLYMRTETLPLRGITSQTGAYNAVAYAPSGMCWWLATASSYALRTYQLGTGTVARDVYHIIKE